MSAKVQVAIDVRPKAPPYVRSTDKKNPWVSVLEVTHDLPDVCARHGNPAVDYVHRKTSGKGVVGRAKERNPGESWLDGPSESQQPLGLIPSGHPPGPAPNAQPFGPPAYSQQRG